MIDLTKPMTVPILSGTVKSCKVMFPTDAQWCERARKQRVVRHFLGRGKSKTDYDRGADEVNLELFTRIRQDDGAPLTAAEATLVLGKLEKGRIEDVERAGDQFVVRLRTGIGDTVHTVSMPTAEDMLAHERRSTQAIDGRRNQEIRGYLEPTGELYDRIVKKADGYAGAVPIVHKVFVVEEVLALMGAQDDELVPEQ